MNLIKYHCNYICWYSQLTCSSATSQSHPNKAAEQTQLVWSPVYFVRKNLILWNAGLKQQTSHLWLHSPASYQSLIYYQSPIYFVSVFLSPPVRMKFGVMTCFMVVDSLIRPWMRKSSLVYWTCWNAAKCLSRCAWMILW